MAYTRRSGALLQELQGVKETDTKQYITKHNQWMQAVTEELELLYKQQEETSKKVTQIEEDKEIDLSNISTNKSEGANSAMKQEIDALTEQIMKIQQENKNTIIKLHEVQQKNEELHEENKMLREQVTRLQSIIEDDTLYKELQSNLVKQIDEVAEEQECKLNELEARISQIKRTTITHPVENLEPSSKLKIPIPKFEGTEEERPIKFINDLEKYLALKKLNEEEQIQLLQTVLQKEAGDWWYIYQDDVKTFQQFKDLFIDRFWNEDIQRITKRKVEFGHYYENGKLTRVAYATQIFNFAKELSLSYTPEQLAEKICSHFSRSVRQAFQFSQNKDKATLFKILADYDSDDKQQNKKLASKNFNSHSQNNTQGQSKPTNKNNYKDNQMPSTSKYNSNTTENKYENNKRQFTQTVNATQIAQSNAKQKSTQKDKNKPQFSKKTTKQSHDNIDISKIEIEQKTNDGNHGNA